MKGLVQTIVKSLVDEAVLENPGTSFWDSFHDLLAGGKVILQSENNIPLENSRSEIVGFWHKGLAHILWKTAYNTVVKYKDISHSDKAVLEDLFAQGKSLDDSPKIRKMNGTSSRIVRLNLDVNRLNSKD